MLCKIDFLSLWVGWVAKLEKFLVLRDSDLGLIVRHSPSWNRYLMMFRCVVLILLAKCNLFLATLLSLLSDFLDELLESRAIGIESVYVEAFADEEQLSQLLVLC